MIDQVTLQIGFEISSFLLFVFAVLKFSNCVKKPESEVRV